MVTLERLAGETADLLVNGSAIARGEVVVIDEQYGLRVTEILDREQDSESPDAGVHADAEASAMADGAEDDTQDAVAEGSSEG